MNAIDDINWAALHHASGTCEHVPEALRSLTSEVEGAREAAYWKLDNYVVLQGDLSESAPYVVRALLEILPGAKAGKDLIYNLLVELANGDAPGDHQVIFDGEQRTFKQATVKALLEGVSTYRKDLMNDSSIVRRRVCELLLALSDHVKLSSQELAQLERDEKDGETRKLLRELREISG